MWIEETKNGKYKCCEQYKDYMTGKKKKVSITVPDKKRKTLKEAEKSLKDKIKKMESDPPERKQLTFGELTELYLEHAKDSLKESTYVGREDSCNVWNRTIGKSVLVDNISASFLEKKLKEHSAKPSTFNNHCERIKALFRWAYKKGYVADISFLDRLELMKEPSRKKKIQDKFLEPEELQLVLDSLPSRRYYLLTKLLVLSGMRIGEATALTTDDIDFENGVIHVTKTYSTKLNKIMDSPKTETSERDIFMQPELAKICKEILSFTREDSMKYGYRTNMLLCSQHGNPIHEGNYDGYLKKYVPESINKVVVPHTFRHTHASILASQGVSIDAISRRLGHENESITREIYLHVTKKLVEQDNAQFAKVHII